MPYSSFLSPVACFTVFFYLVDFFCSETFNLLFHFFRGIVSIFSFQPVRLPLMPFFWGGGNMVVINSAFVHLNVFISPSLLKNSFASYKILG